jgi:formylglycine-generating enzyme required for sulfatase activity
MECNICSKTFFLVMAFVCILIPVSNAQSGDIVVNCQIIDSVNYKTIPEDTIITNIITAVLNLYNIDNNIIVKSNLNTETCIATQCRGEKYILYNKDFMDIILKHPLNLNDTIITKEQWSRLLMLTHVIGHHLNNHLNNPLALSVKSIELKADETAGFVLYRLGAPDFRVIRSALISIYGTFEKSLESPTIEDRIRALETGWQKAELKTPRNRTTVIDSSVTVRNSDFFDPIVGKMIFVKGGEFLLGCTNKLLGCVSDELPVHPVQLSDYFIGETEVTQIQWSTVMGTQSFSYNQCESCPVEKVNWADVQNFISKLNTLSGGNYYRLPTEAEWEYAARGGIRSKGYLYSGSDNIDEVAFYYNNSGERNIDGEIDGELLRSNGCKSHPVKSKKCNELGLYDMSGNVYEWCSDRYSLLYYSNSKLVNPAGPESGLFRVTRGGSWVSKPKYCRISCRSYNKPDIPRSETGFRLVRSVSSN